MEIFLTNSEIAELDRQRPNTKKDGGWEGLLVGLQEKVDRVTGRLVLDQQDLERLPRYAFDYGRGGWEKRLQSIFGRTLGPNLGRRQEAA